MWILNLTGGQQASITMEGLVGLLSMPGYLLPALRYYGVAGKEPPPKPSPLLGGLVALLLFLAPLMKACGVSCAYLGKVGPGGAIDVIVNPRP